MRAPWLRRGWLVMLKTLSRPYCRHRLWRIGRPWRRFGCANFITYPLSGWLIICFGAVTAFYGIAAALAGIAAARWL